MKTPVENPEIVEATPPVPLGTPEKNNVVAECPADLARAVSPGLGFQCLAVYRTSVCTRVVELLVVVEHLKKVLDGSNAGVKGLKSCEALLFKTTGGVM